MLSEYKERLTELLSKVVRKHTGGRVAKWFGVKQTTLWQWSAGERESPLEQTLQFLVELKHKDRELYREIIYTLAEGLEEDTLMKLIKVNKLSTKILECFLDDYRFDETEKKELRGLLSELLDTERSSPRRLT